jgi:transposase
LEDGENELTVTARRLLRNLLDHLLSLDVEIAEVTKRLVEQTKQIPACRELARMPGIGWLVAGAQPALGTKKPRFCTDASRD